jgi:hypothetical protein
MYIGNHEWIFRDGKLTSDRPATKEEKMTARGYLRQIVADKRKEAALAGPKGGGKGG